MVLRAPAQGTATRTMPIVRLLPLGGLGEVGMNCLALEQRGEVLVVDCGVTFDNRGLGVDVVHPDWTALEPYRVAGLFVTHGHEGHIGAIPYFLRRFDVPVFGPGIRARAPERAGGRNTRFSNMHDFSKSLRYLAHMRRVRSTSSPFE